MISRGPVAGAGAAGVAMTTRGVQTPRRGWRAEPRRNDDDADEPGRSAMDGHTGQEASTAEAGALCGRRKAPRALTKTEHAPREQPLTNTNRPVSAVFKARSRAEVSSYSASRSATLVPCPRASFPMIPAMRVVRKSVLDAVNHCGGRPFKSAKRQWRNGVAN